MRLLPKLSVAAVLVAGTTAATVWAQWKEPKAPVARTFDAAKLVLGRLNPALKPTISPPKVNPPPARITAAEFAAMKPHLAKVLGVAESSMQGPSAANTVTVAVGNVPNGGQIQANYITSTGSVVETPGASSQFGNMVSMLQGGTVDGGNALVFKESTIVHAGTYLITCYVFTTRTSVPYQVNGDPAGFLQATAPVQNGVVMIPFSMQNDSTSLTVAFPMDASYPINTWLNVYSCDFMKVD